MSKYQNLLKRASFFERLAQKNQPAEKPQVTSPAQTATSPQQSPASTTTKSTQNKSPSKTEEDSAYKIRDPYERVKDEDFNSVPQNIFNLKRLINKFLKVKKIEIRQLKEDTNLDQETKSAIYQVKSSLGMLQNTNQELYSKLYNDLYDPYYGTVFDPTDAVDFFADKQKIKNLKVMANKYSEIAKLPLKQLKEDTNLDQETKYILDQIKSYVGIVNESNEKLYNELYDELQRLDPLHHPLV